MAYSPLALCQCSKLCVAHSAHLRQYAFIARTREPLPTCLVQASRCASSFVRWQRVRAKFLWSASLPLLSGCRTCDDTSPSDGSGDRACHWRDAWSARDRALRNTDLLDDDSPP